MQDLWNIGKAIGLPGFHDSKDHELDAMNAALARAKRKDRREMRATDEEVLNQRMEAFVAGTGENEGVDTRFRLMTTMWMTRLQKKYEGAVICRNRQYTDYLGESITGVKPFEEHHCLLPLHEHEYKTLERLAEKAMDSETFVRQFASEVSQRIYLCLHCERTDEVMWGSEFFLRYPEDSAAPMVYPTRGF